MRKPFFTVLGIFLITQTASFAESNGKQNRRNRGGPTLQVVEKTKLPKPKPQRKMTAEPKQMGNPIVHMPAAFDSSVVDPKDYVEETVVYEPAPQELEQVEEKVAKVEKGPRIIKNDPEKMGVDSNAFYKKLSGESRRVFQEMDQKGKVLALRLSIPYQDPNKAVEDAAFEMRRRQQTANLRQQRTQRKRSAYY